MSMLSAQCDELRAMAESVGLAMPQAATLMMDAADTIWELRGALQVASVDYRHLQAENAKLREQMEQLVTLMRNDCDIEASWDGLRRFWSIELTEDGCLMRDRVCKAEAENAKLRELVPILAYCMSEDRDCDRCALNGADMPTPRISACDSLHDLMRELEVTA